MFFMLTMIMVNHNHHEHNRNIVPSKVFAATFAGLAVIFIFLHILHDHLGVELVHAFHANHDHGKS